MIRASVRVAILSVLVILPIPAVFGANYYVDATAGRDTNPGTPSRPWKTLAKVNRSRFEPGDAVYFRRGDIWRATLDVSSSGAPGKPIIFGAYPDDRTLPKPVISCADNVTRRLWKGVLGNGGFRVDSKATCPQKIPGWTIHSTHGYSCAIKPEADGNNALRITNWRGNTDLVSTPVRTYAGAPYTLQGWVRATRGGHVFLYLFASHPHRFYLRTSGVGRAKWARVDRRSARPFFVTSSENWVHFYVRFTGVSASLVRFRASVRGTQGTARLLDIMLIDGRRNYWTLSTDHLSVPRVLLVNGVRISREGGADKKRRWYARGGPYKLVRYVSRTAAPSGVVELGVRRTGILLYNKSYVTLENLVVDGCEGSYGRPLMHGAGILLSSGSSHNLIRNVVVKNSVEGIRVQGKGLLGQMNTANVFTDFVVSNGVSQGIALRSYASGNLISKCRIHDINMLLGDDVLGDKEAISIGGTVGNGPGNTVQDCEVYNVGVYARGGMGIAVFNSPDTTIRRNYVHDIGAIGIGVGTNGNSPAKYQSDDDRIYYNVVARTGESPLADPGQGIAVTVSDNGSIRDMRIDNNTVVGCELNDNKDGGISIRGVANPDKTVNMISNVQIENNIVSGCKGSHPRVLFIGSRKIVAMKNLVSDYNLFEPSSDILPHQSFISYEGANYTVQEFAKYQQRDHQDRHSIIGDPLFINPLDSDYRLCRHSPARHAGEDVGLHYDRLGNPIVGRPDIGAY